MKKILSSIGLRAYYTCIRIIPQDIRWKIILPSIGLRVYYTVSRIKCRSSGLRFVPPNYAFFEEFLQDGIAIDVGVGESPDFTLFLMKAYNIESFVIDPTLKHMVNLKIFERQHPMAHYLPFALGAKSELRKFYESQSSESGTLRKDHKNIRKDAIVAYTVQVVTLSQLLEKCGNKPVSIMKIDIEGEEYEFVQSVKESDLRKIRQLIIEFHHGIVKAYSMAATLKAIETIENLGMKSVVYNGRDCLFYWEN
jgi:FkbM family methyltransferase